MKQPQSPSDTEDAAKPGAPHDDGEPDGSTAPEAIPERPALAPNVTLSGETQEDGFEQRQFLAERDGRFIQLTELLYLVAAQADGQRTHEEMATAVSQAVGREVSAANVRQLVGGKLVPLGLVAKVDGSVADRPEHGEAGPLPRGQHVDEDAASRLITPATAVLKHLYRPPILISVLAVALAAQAWIFFVHGVGGVTDAALIQPGLMLLALGIVVLSAAWHEFGHAAALEYGGGHVCGMGAGLYIVYPAFYTDVTDNYRLGRWARVRTGLGGFYFKLIFTLFVIAAYLLTGEEVLLFVIVLIDLDILRQMLPFVRLDGYWALADVTGIPDFFSQIGPYLRTVLPLPWWKGRQLPNLKPWVKVVFGLYVAVTVPLLLFLLFFVVRSVPDILATTWDSASQQRATFTAARASGDELGMASASVQLLILAIPIFGLLFILYTLAKKLARTIWTFSKPTPARCLTGALATVAVVPLIAYLWVA